MYLGKPIKTINESMYKKLNQIFINNGVDLINPPNPYNIIKQQQQKDRQKNKKSNIPYNWVHTTTQSLNNSNSFQDPNSSITISRVEISRQQGISRQFNQFQNQNQSNIPTSIEINNNFNNSNYIQRSEWTNNQSNNLSNNISFSRNNITNNQNNQRNLSSINQLIDDDYVQDLQIQYEEVNFDQPKYQPQRYQIKEEKQFQNKIKARDIFKKQQKKQQKQPKGNQKLCGLIECNTNKKLTTLKILEPVGPLVRNYEMGDAKMWQINNKYPDYILRQALRNFPHIKDFKNNQKAVIKCALNGNDVFVCIPTGGGKSLIFQIMTFIKKGIYLCILPLISLIYDQQLQAQKFNIEAYSLTGATNVNKVKQIYSKLSSFTPDKKSIMIFCTPEKISLSQNFIQILTSAYNKGYLQHVIIDEVHCVSTWGKQFRKQYQNLSEVKVFFPKIPILALTATVTESVKQQIIKKLKLIKCTFFQSSFNRPNLMYQVRPKTKKSAIDEISSILENHKHQSGIIYCLSKKQCEQMCKNLNNRSYRTAFYHADLHDNDKRQIQQLWMQNKINIIIATIAFGMGINKPDVRFVIHNSLSKSLQNYYQESGRAGRDGDPAKCILFYQRSDRTALQCMILKNQYSSAASKMFSNRQLAQMVKYCQQKYSCRRQFQLNYLGQKDFDRQMCQKTCDNCIKGREYKNFQCIAHGKEIVRFLKFVHETKDRITKAQMISILKNKSNKGNKNAKVFSYPLLQKINELFKYWTNDQIEQILLELLSEQVLKETVVTTHLKKIGNVSNVYIQCNVSKSHKFLDRVETLPMPRQIKAEKISKGLPTTINRQNICNELFGDQEAGYEYESKQTGSSYEGLNPSESYDRIDFEKQGTNIDFGQFEYNESFDQRANQIRMENSQNQFPEISMTAKILAESKSKDETRAQMLGYLSELFDDQQNQI